MQTRSGGLSVSQTLCFVAKREKDLSNVHIFISHDRSFSLVFWEEKCLVEGDHFYVTFCVNRLPLERNRRFSVDIRSQRLSGSS